MRKTTDGGANWVELSPPSSNGLTGIHFVDANTGWVSGPFGAIMKTTNGGTSWASQTHPTGAHCWSVFALSSSLAWQAGSSGMLGRTTNGGATWLGTEGNPVGNPGFGQYDVYFTDANTGYSVAGGNWSAKTVNGGVTWTQMSTSNSAQLYKVNFANANTGWAVGVGGTILKTTNAGASWVTQTSGTTETLTGVSFVDANVGWVVGANGTILRTQNGGTTWTPEVSGTTQYLGDVHFVDATHGWVVGENNTVLKYDAGPTVTTLIDDNFDNGNTATNTLGTGAGFVSRGQVASTESSGFLNLDNAAGAATRVYMSNTANAHNPFQTLPTTLTYTFGAVNRGADHQRLWVGYRTTNNNDHFFPNTGVQGLYVSVLSQNIGEDGYPQLGNLVAVSNSGVSTTLASWNWSNSDALSGLTVSLTTTGTQYALQFSGAAGGTPSFVAGAASGTLSGLGTIGGNFDCGIHNQYWFDNGGGVKLDRVLLQQSSAPFNFPPTIVLPASPLIVEASSASGAIATFSVTGTDTESGALTGSGVPASGSTFALGDTTVTGSVTDGTNTTTGNFIVRVRDTTAPVVTAPANVTVASTSMAGATVTYPAATAADAVTASPSITYSHASGATFPVGVTTVTVSAADGAGNTGTGTFTVTVQALAGTLAFANATPSANPVNGSGLINTVPVIITRTGGTVGAITVEVVPSQPATVPTGFAKYVYGTDYQFVSGTAAGSTVSFAAGQASATVDILLNTPVLTKKGQLKLTLASTTGGSIIGSPAAATLTINARDTATPTIVLNTPAAGATFDITGTVKDAGGLASLIVKVNGATLPLTVDPVTGYVANAIAPYSVLGVAAENGANVILVTAKDLSGNTITATKTVTYTNNRPALTGTYTALIKPTGTPDGDTAGFLTATVTDAGKLTGKVTLSGVTIAFTGLLNNAGAATFGTTNAAALDLIDGTEFEAYLGALSFSISSPAGLVGMLNTSASGGTVLATCTGTKTPYSSTNLVPAGLLTAATKGVYTVAFPSKAQSPVLTASAYPQGDGYATLTLSNAGVITVLGKLADGTALSASGNLRADGTLPFFASLYKKLGLVAGDITFANLADSDISGTDLLWIRPNQSSARYYRTGWTSGIRIDAVGAKYTSPAALDFGQGAVDSVNGNAALVFTDGQLASSITHNVNVNPTTGAITRVPVVGAPYTHTLTASTGVFSGTFTHGGATDKYYGVLINKGANKAGFGYFLSTVPLVYGASGESGGVTLQP